MSWLKLQNKPLRKIIKNYIPLLIIPLVYGMLLVRPLLASNSIAFGGDAQLPFQSGAYLERLSYSYNWWGDFGSSLPSVFANTPILENMFFSLLTNGLKLTFNTSFYFYIIIASMLSFISVYFLTTTIFYSSKHRFLIGLISATIYLFCPVFFSDTFKTLFYMLSFNLSLFYLLISIVIWGFKKRNLNYSILSAVVSMGVFIASPVATYRWIVFFLFFYLLLGIYILFAERHKKKQFVLFWFKFLALFSFLSFLINIYWLYPLFTHLGEHMQFLDARPLNFFYNQWSTLPNTLRLLSSWGFWTGYVPFAELYSTNPILVVLTFSWPFLVFSALLLSLKNKKILVLTGITVFALFVAKGSNPPLESIYIAIVSSNIGGFYPFKAFYVTTPITLFVLPPLYSLLSAYTIVELSKRIPKFNLKIDYLKKNRFSKGINKRLLSLMLVVIFCTPIFIIGWPMVTGEIMTNYYSNQNGTEQYGVAIPNDYKNANNFIMDDVVQSNFDSFMVRGLFLPKVSTYIGTNWYYQGASNFYNLYFEIPIVTGNSIPYGVTVSKESFESIYNLPFKSLNKTESLKTMTIATAKELIPLFNSMTAKAWQNGTIVVTSNRIEIESLGEISSYNHLDFSINFEKTQSLAEFDFLSLELSTDVPEQGTWIGISDSNGTAEWWRSELHSFQNTNESRSYYFPLSNSERGKDVDLSNITSLRIRLDPPSTGTITIVSVSGLSTKENAIVPQELIWSTFQGDAIEKGVNQNTLWAINASSNPQKWHQIMLQLPWSQNWESYNYFNLMFEQENINMTKLMVGFGDETEKVGWYNLPNPNSYESYNNTLTFDIPLNQRPDSSDFNRTMVTTIWLRYYVTEGELYNPKLIINDVSAYTSVFDDYMWAQNLAFLNIGYLIIDKSIIDGLETSLEGNASYYTEYLNDSIYFKQIFTSEKLIVYKNEVFDDEIKVLSDESVAIKTTQVTPTKIVVNTISSTSFEIILPVAYSERWSASIIGKDSNQQLNRSLRSGPEQIANTWEVNDTGNLTIIIEYTSQTEFEFGLAISVITLILCAVYIVYGLAEDMSLLSRIKQKLSYLKQSVANLESSSS